MLKCHYLVCGVVEEGVHVVIVRLLHLSQEAALLVDRFVTYQTLQHNSGESHISLIIRPFLLYHYQQNTLNLVHVT